MHPCDIELRVERIQVNAEKAWVRSVATVVGLHEVWPRLAVRFTVCIRFERFQLMNAACQADLLTLFWASFDNILPHFDPVFFWEVLLVSRVAAELQDTIVEPLPSRIVRIKR